MSIWAINNIKTGKYNNIKMGIQIEGMLRELMKIRPLLILMICEIIEFRKSELQSRDIRNSLTYI